MKSNLLSCFLSLVLLSCGLEDHVTPAETCQLAQLTRGGGFSSPAYTLGISAPSIQDTASYCYWAYSFSPPTSLRVGQSVTLKAKVRLDKVQGRGVSLVLRGDRRNQPTVLFTTREGKLPLNGTADYREYSVTLPYTSAVDYLLAYFLLLSNTTGSTTLSDISVNIN